MYHAAGTAGLTAPAAASPPAEVAAAKPADDVVDDVVDDGEFDDAAEEPVVGRRMNAQYRPSGVVVMLTTSQPSAERRVSSAANDSGLALNGCNAAYSNMVGRLPVALRQ